jgi:hypothetical protein
MRSTTQRKATLKHRHITSRLSHFFESVYLVLQVSDSNHKKESNSSADRPHHESVLIPHVRPSIDNAFTPRKNAQAHAPDKTCAQTRRRGAERWAESLGVTPPDHRDRPSPHPGQMEQTRGAHPQSESTILVCVGMGRKKEKKEEKAEETIKKHR